MPSSGRRPTIDERDAFLLKLIGFRQELTPVEQRMLDAMAIAAFCVRRPEPARGYADLRREDVRPDSDDSPWMAFYE